MEEEEGELQRGGVDGVFEERRPEALKVVAVGPVNGGKNALFVRFCKGQFTGIWQPKTKDVYCPQHPISTLRDTMTPAGRKRKKHSITYHQYPHPFFIIDPNVPGENTLVMTLHPAPIGPIDQIGSFASSRLLLFDIKSPIVLSGGSTMFEGIVQRLGAEVQEMVPKNARVKVNAPTERRYSVWMGGSILSSLSTFTQMWVSHEEYDDSGASIIHRKCF